MASSTGLYLNHINLKIFKKIHLNGDLGKVTQRHHIKYQKIDPKKVIYKTPREDAV